ncbi:MAG: hypothetical protein WAO76_00125 [Georgfuchsia sp.]
MKLPNKPDVIASRRRSNPCPSLPGSPPWLRIQVKTVAGLYTMALAISSCVTINIYFPASAAEKAADKIIDEVWQSRGDGGAPADQPPTSDKMEKP